MEETYSIACLDCRVYLWIGQPGIIYPTIETRQNLQKFLFNHLNHNLKFASSDSLEKDDNCRDITPDFGK